MSRHSQWTIRSRRGRLQFESLENRWLLACEVFEQGGKLFVIGDETSNKIEIVGTDQGVQVTCDGHDHGSFSQINAIDVQTDDGNDTVGIQLAGKYDKLLLAVNTGDGDDRFSLFETTVNGRAELAIDAGSGKDLVEIPCSYFNDLQLDVALGEGDDHFSLFETNVARLADLSVDAGDGKDLVEIPCSYFNDLQLDVALGEGDDHFSLFETNVARLADVSVDAGDGKDLVEIPCSYFNDLQLDVALGDGDDHFSLFETSVAGLADVSVDAGDGNNVSRVEIADQPSAPPPQDPQQTQNTTVFNFNYVGGDGKDEIRLHTHYTAPIVVQNVKIATAGGKDSLDWNLLRTGQGGSFTSTIDIDMGADADTVQFDAAFIPDAPCIIVANTAIKSGEGRDTIDFAWHATTHQQENKLTIDSGEDSDVVKTVVRGHFDAELRVNLGEGNNTFTLEAPEGWEAAAIPKDPCVIVEAGGGNDSIVLRFGGPLTANLEIIANLGDGNDSFLLDAQQGLQVAAIPRDPDIVVEAGDGNDSVAFRFGGPLSAPLEVQARLGEGNNSFLLDAEQGWQAAAIPGGPCLLVEAGGGYDSVLLRFGGPLTANLEIIANLGDGNNSFLLDAQQGWQAAAIPGSPCNLVEAGSGNDSVELRFGGPLTANLEIIANLGDGNDSFLLDAQQGWEAAAIPSNPCSIVEAGGGNDSVTFRFGGVVSASLEILADLGVGNDEFLLDAQGGFSATPDPKNPQAGPSVQVTGGAHNDKITLHLGEVSGNLRVDVDGMEGNDHLAADLLFAEQGLGLVDIALNGDDGNDLLSLLAFGQSDPQHAQLLIDGGNGIDTCIATPNVKTLNCERHRPPPQPK